MIAFYGSSSIRLWATLASDFPGLSVVNLGFGGATLAACVYFFERLVLPCSPASLVLYAGDNDLGDGRRPEDVAGSLNREYHLWHSPNLGHEVYFNTPLHFIPNLEDEEILDQLRRLEITLVVGDADPFIGTNIELSEALWQKGIPHELFIWEGRAHKASYWRQMAPLYL